MADQKGKNSEGKANEYIPWNFIKSEEDFFERVQRHYTGEELEPRTVVVMTT